MPANRKAVAFLVLTLALSLGPVALAWSHGARDIMHGGLASASFLLSPALSAIACAIVFDRGARLQALGLPPRLNLWPLAGLAAPFIIAPIGIGAVLALSPYAYRGIGGLAAQAGAVPPWLAGLPHSGLAALLIARTISGMLLAVPEELGWRGYLYRQWRPLGFWRVSLVTGIAWSLWHWPIMLAFGLNMVPGHAIASLALFTLYTALLAPTMTWLRDRGGSVWPPVVFHGALNAVVGLVFLLWDRPTFPWDWLALGGAAGLGLGIMVLVRRRLG